MIMHKIYGWIPDIPDQRDYLYSAIKPRIRLPNFEEGLKITVYRCLTHKDWFLNKWKIIVPLYGG